jgi:hypothetical protein
MPRLNPADLARVAHRLPHQLREELGVKPGKRQKYRNTPTELDGIRFDSKRESLRYLVLKSLEATGIIRGLRVHVPFEIHVNGMYVTTYEADFVYEQKEGTGWRQVVEDSKGYRTREYRLKKRLVLAALDIDILET